MRPSNAAALESRSRQLDRIAYELGLEFTFEDDWGLINLLRDFRLFRRGRSKRITNILCHKDAMLETTLRIFDYKYKTHGQHGKLVRQTVFFADSRKLGLPEFWMKPELFIHKIGALLGFEDINFESHPEFSRQYYLKSSDEYYLRSKMSDEVLRFFTIEKDWRLEGINYFLIFYKKGVIFPPEQIKRFYHKGRQVLELFREDK